MDTYCKFLEENVPTVSTDMFIIWSSLINSVYFHREIGLYTDNERLNKLLQVAEKYNVIVPNKNIENVIKMFKKIWNIQN